MFLEFNRIEQNLQNVVFDGFLMELEPKREVSLGDDS
jgi:hypothetical protein